MAWCSQATSHYLSQYWPRSMLPYGFTGPQWFNIWGVLTFGHWEIMYNVVFYGWVDKIPHAGELLAPLNLGSRRASRRCRCGGPCGTFGLSIWARRGCCRGSGSSHFVPIAWPRISPRRWAVMRCARREVWVSMWAAGAGALIGTQCGTAIVVQIAANATLGCTECRVAGSRTTILGCHRVCRFVLHRLLRDIHGYRTCWQFGWIWRGESISLKKK